MAATTETILKPHIPGLTSHIDNLRSMLEKLAEKGGGTATKEVEKITDALTFLNEKVDDFVLFHDGTCVLIEVLDQEVTKFLNIKGDESSTHFQTIVKVGKNEIKLLREKINEYEKIADDEMNLVLANPAGGEAVPAVLHEELERIRWSPSGLLKCWRGLKSCLFPGPEADPHWNAMKGCQF